MKRAAAMAAPFALLALLAGCGCSGDAGSGRLVLGAPRTTLRPGESVRVSAGLRTLSGVHPLPADSLEWHTTGESVMLVERDGRVTAIGTNGRARESAIVGANRGARHASLRFFVEPGGRGPSLAITTGAGREPCTAWPVELCVILHEGDSLSFRVHERDGTDVTARASGTRYQVFAGSGSADDPNPGLVIGGTWPESLNADAIRIDDRSGTLRVPASIAPLRWFGVTILVRHGESVGWLFVRVDPRTSRGARDTTGGNTFK